MTLGRYKISEAQLDKPQSRAEAKRFKAATKARKPRVKGDLVERLSATLQGVPEMEPGQPQPLNPNPERPRFDLQGIQAKQATLAEAKRQLKTEFFGLDTIIDRVVDSLYAWYLFPQLITRPVIIDLWGMTGVGKTQLVRRLSNLLGYTRGYVEVQMDGFSNGGFRQDSIASILRSSSIEEGKPGILLLDEIQRFRTVDDQGGDAKVERYQDVWMLLSDGKLSAEVGVFREIEDMLTYSLWRDDQKKGEEPDEDEVAEQKAMALRKFKLAPYEASHLKQLLRLTEDVKEIMTWDNFRLQAKVEEVRQDSSGWEIDYSKLLIFVSGNLDEAFTSAGRADDCDTDADIYHEMTKKITVSDIKTALGRRFKPEQISRLGNNHIIYPSLSRDSYERLILSQCDKYVRKMEELSGLVISVDPGIYQEIYENSVYPTQGTRPVFSSVHKIFSSALSNIAVWAIENSHTGFLMSIDTARSVLVGTALGSSTEVPVDLDVRLTRKQNSLDFNTLVAVHESGHALLYALLFQQPPQEVKINLATFKGGYMMHQDKRFSTKKQMLHRICVSLGGTEAEGLVFGDPSRADGCTSDTMTATAVANAYVRQLGFANFNGYVAGDNGRETDTITDLEKTNDAIEAVLAKERANAATLLNDHRHLLARLTEALLERKRLSPEEFIELLPELDLQVDREEGYSAAFELWKTKK